MSSMSSVPTSFSKCPAASCIPRQETLQPVNGLYLRIGYDFSAKSQNHLRYKKTLGQGQAGVNMWAQNVGEYYTVQKSSRRANTIS